jgi:hypothetical protein
MKNSRQMSAESVILSSIVNFVLTLLIYSLALHHYFLIQCVPKAFLAFFISVGIYWLIELLPIRIPDDSFLAVFGTLTCFCVLLGRWLGSAWLTAIWAGSSVIGLFLLLVSCALVAQNQYWMGSINWFHTKIGSYKAKAKAKKEQQLAVKEKDAEMNFNRKVDI